MTLGMDHDAHKPPAQGVNTGTRYHESTVWWFSDGLNCAISLQSTYVTRHGSSNTHERSEGLLMNRCSCPSFLTENIVDYRTYYVLAW